MNIILFFICITILFICPVLYPPLASFTAIFFIKNNKISNLSLFLIFSSVTVTSLISATIIPIADTVVYINSFQSISKFDFTELAMDNDGFEPLYKIYEYCLSLFIDDSQNLFLLITAFIFNALSTIAIIRICLRLNQLKLSCIILTVQYSLVAPALGVPMFLLRSALSLSIMFLAMSFYKQRQTVFYILGTISIFIHFSSLLIFGTLILNEHWYYWRNKLTKIGKQILFISISKTLALRISFVMLVVGIIIITASPSLMTSFLKGFLISFGESGNAASGKAKSFLDAQVDNFVDLKNPVVLIHIAISCFCFFKLRDDLSIKPNIDKAENQNLIDFLESLRLIGRLLTTIIIYTAPFNFLPFRTGFFNFLNFPLWLINVPFVSLLSEVKKQSRYLISFALICVLTYTFYWMPKRQGQDYFIVVLESRAMDYNLFQLIEKLL